MCVFAAGCAKGQPGGSDPDAPDHGGPDAPINPIIDANRGPDAPPQPDGAMHPDAQPDAMSGCTVQQVQLLLNRSFDAAPIGVNWSALPFDPGYPLITPPPAGVTANSAPNIVWMGGFLNGSDRLYQDVAIPAGTTALQLKGRRFFASAELGGVYDVIHINLMTTSDVQLAHLQTWNNNNTSADFVAFTLTSPSPFAGQTVRLAFDDSCDDTNNTNFFLDSMQLLATVCQ